MFHTEPILSVSNNVDIKKNNILNVNVINIVPFLSTNVMVSVKHTMLWKIEMNREQIDSTSIEHFYSITTATLSCTHRPSHCIVIQFHHFLQFFGLTISYSITIQTDNVNLIWSDYFGKQLKMKLLSWNEIIIMKMKLR